MALKTDFKDDIFTGARKYRMVNNPDGTVSFVDVTDYTQEGDYLGSQEVNAITTEVNAVNKRVDDVEQKGVPAAGGDADTVRGHTVEANVPAGAKFTDTVYIHPSSHPASIITQDANHRFVTDTEKGAWNGKAAGSHTHPASQVTAGTLPVGVLATNSTDYTASRLRNVRFGTTVPSSLANGEVYMMYE